MFEDILKLSRSAGVDSDQYGTWGKQATKRLVEDGTHPNETIQKIASDNNLNSDEIDRVVEFANLETYSHFLKNAQAGEKTFEFPVASKADIVNGGGKTKAAMPNVFFTDYDRPLDSDLSKTAGLDVFEAFGVAPTTEKVACPKRGEDLLLRLELSRQNVRDKLAMNMEKLKDSGEEFFKHIRQEVLKGKEMADVERAIKSKVKDKPSEYSGRVMELLAWSKRKLYDEGVLLESGRHGDATAGDSDDVKTAEAVEPDLITDTFESPYIPVSVINGRHPLFASIDTLVKQFEEASEGNQGLTILDDAIRYTKHRIYGKQPL